MKKSTIAVCVALMALAACKEEKSNTEEVSSIDTTATSTQSSGKKEWVPIDSAEGMKAYEAYATPGNEHKELAKWDGKWTGESTMWMTAGGQPMKSTLKATNKMINGGRYQMATYTGNMMGMTFEGTGITAYDNYLKKYITIWVDNMGSGIMKMEGTRDEAAKALVFTGTSKDPVNGNDCEMKQVLTDVDENTQKMEMYSPDPKTGEPFKSMEIILKRSK